MIPKDRNQSIVIEKIRDISLNVSPPCYLTVTVNTTVECLRTDCNILVD